MFNFLGNQMTAVSVMPSLVIAKYVDARQPRVTFDPTAVEHRAAYQKFSKTGKWSSGCPFKLEWPFVSVPALCQARLLDYYLTRDIELHK